MPAIALSIENIFPIRSWKSCSSSLNVCAKGVMHSPRHDKLRRNIALVRNRVVRKSIYLSPYTAIRMNRETCACKPRS